MRRCLTVHSIQQLVKIKPMKIQGNELKDTRKSRKVQYYTNWGSSTPCDIKKGMPTHKRWLLVHSNWLTARKLKKDIKLALCLQHPAKKKFAHFWPFQHKLYYITALNIWRLQNRLLVIVHRHTTVFKKSFRVGFSFYLTFKGHTSDQEKLFCLHCFPLLFVA